MYHGKYYSTLADVPVDVNQYWCQDNYITLPGNWVIAPDNSDSRAVIGAHYWSASGVVVAGGKLYYGLYYGSSAGSYWGSGYLDQSGNQYKVSTCNLQILIGRNISFLDSTSPS